MSRSPIFDRIGRLLRVAQHCERHNLPTREGLELLAAQAAQRKTQGANRRDFLGKLGKMAAAAAAAAVFDPARLLAARRPPNINVGIVGAGLAGLTCGDTLKRNGVAAILYEARDRIGGRQWSMGGTFGGPVQFPGQIVERGGELIDNLHKTLLGYAREFGLAREDVSRLWGPFETAWYFAGEHVPESAIVDEFRDFVGAMRRDLTKLSAEVSAASHSAFDRQLDLTNLRQYLETRGAGPRVKAAIDVSYNIEYGLEIEEQSCLNLLFFIHADKRSRFTPFGVFSDERFHIVGGNERIAQGLAARLAGQFELETRLMAARKLGDGRIELSLERGAQTLTRVHDAVIFALPFSMLRQVSLHPSLGLPPAKLQAIQDMRYGTNAKLNVGFNGRFWLAQRRIGSTYSDLPNHQTTWEVNPANATGQHAVLVDYSGGNRGAGLNPSDTNQEAARFLGDLDLVLPGALAAAARVSADKYLAHLQHWPSDPNIQGSYTCNHPGYFTEILGNEGPPVGNLYFAGEHTDLFYDWQGFMEGAANSGIRAAGEILSDFR